MFKVNHYFQVDHWGVGTTLAVQYDFVDESKTEKRPAGIVWTVMFFTRLIEIGFWW